ncbi:MAG: hypothetical protein A2Z77_05605 [Chloroflexi bacterium RBG_13_51_36]|nr:MAG: hypothetical protein A2Z77_05605 [Chloroflexi bacterium RBG_13_51_36]
MAGRITLVGLITALLIILLPSLATAQDIDFSVIPAVVRINSLPPGEATAFNLTIHNKDEIAHVFTLTAFPPPEEERWEGRTEFPDTSWISFSSPEIEVAANFAANVTVTVAIPRQQQWAGQNWEVWLGVNAESSDLLGVELYARLLVSTASAVKSRFNAGLFAGIAAAIVLVGYGIYYYVRRKARFD